ncbi:Type III pantothenate kinase [Varanus komodoensis]|nr:Type III pantothenate kinase [Varanus komodoensis]
MNHINFLELLAVFKALRYFEDILHHQIVQITSDSIATIVYLNKQGGTKSPTLARLSMKIWDWCIWRHITLMAVHLASVDNVQADLLSRHMFTSHEWELDPRTRNHLFRCWGFPDMDLFATQQNRVCEAYCSRAGIGHASLGDAFMIPWNNMNFYAFPPIPLLMQVIAKIVYDQVSGMLVAPWWPRQTWFAKLLDISRGEFLHLPSLPYRITQVGGTLRHPDLLSLRGEFDD